MKQSKSDSLPDKVMERIDRLDEDEGGAVLMLMLAGVLICFMATLVLYDAGLATNDKMAAQAAADASAFSGSVVKARTMNMVSVANTNKRILYGISTTYTAAYLALLSSTGAYTTRCIGSWGTDFSACKNMVVGIVQSAIESIELVATNIPQMYYTSRTEVQNLEKYQDYMITITPWWAWIDSLIRAMANNATFASTWPPPGDVAEVMDRVTEVAQGLDFLFGSTLSSFIPAHSSAIDGLPLARRDKDHALGSFGAMADMCQNYVFSMDHVMLFAEHMIKSSGSGISKKPQTIVLYLGLVTPIPPMSPLSIPSLPCIVAWGLLSNEVFDYRIAGAAMFPNIFSSSTSPGDDWLQATSFTAFAYKARDGRNNDEKGRQKYSYMKQDYNSWFKTLNKNEGYMAMARSEIVYVDPGLVSNLFGSFASIPLLSNMVNRPDMWSPGWTAKLRPVTLPGEKHGATVQLMGDGSDIGLSEMVIDMVPFLIVSGLLGIFDANSGLGSMLMDMFAFAKNSQGFTAENMEGIAK